MNPRIYTYKVTFEEIPDWYWGVHKEKGMGNYILGHLKLINGNGSSTHPTLRFWKNFHT
jgi:hypothetical protein